MAAPSGTVTFLFTDIEGSTRLWEERGEEMSAALARHDTLLRKAIESNGGVVFSTGGDGLAAAFATAPYALTAALTAQGQLSEDTLLRVRMALHTGAAEERDGDYFGPVLNRCARLAAVAHGCQVLCSGATAELVRDCLADGVALLDLGEHRLRDLSRPEHVFQIVHSSLPGEFGPLRSLDAYPTNLPVQAGVLVGRERELAEIASAVDSARVVTLTGVGGVGKTRLALQAAADALPHFGDGAWLIELAPLADPEGLIEVVASGLGVPDRQGQTRSASLDDFLRSKHLMLLLDNCEHLLEASARFVQRVSSTCPEVTVLATSREGLGVPGERLLTVRISRTARGVGGSGRSRSSGFGLPVHRARSRGQSWLRPDPEQRERDRPSRRLDGIPLALELAAARVRSLTPWERAERLDERFRLLGSGRRTVVERHQTLHRAIDWSYDLLADEEKRALARASVFAGDFSLRSAEEVIVDDVVAAFEVADLLGRLVDKSLLLADELGEATRYRMLETIRQYGQEQLELAGEAELLRHRHAQHFARFAESAGTGMRGPEEALWTLLVEAELDNLSAAWGWAFAEGEADLAMRLVAPLALNGTRIGYVVQLWAAQAAAMPGAPSTRLFPEVLAVSGWAAAVAGRVRSTPHRTR
jgi:predicted ATPase/class 3 adenylate cyclase